MELSSWVMKEGNAFQHIGLPLTVREEGATGTTVFQMKKRMNNLVPDGNISFPCLTAVAHFADHSEMKRQYDFL